MTTSERSTSVTVYDSLGAPHRLTMSYAKTADAPTPTWDVHVTAAGSEIDPPVAQDYVEVGTGTLDFGTDGSLTANTLPTVNVPWLGADPGSITLDLGSPAGTGGTGVDGLTSGAGTSAATSISQDGSGTGELGLAHGHVRCDAARDGPMPDPLAPPRARLRAAGTRDADVPGDGYSAPAPPP